VTEDPVIRSVRDELERAFGSTAGIYITRWDCASGTVWKAEVVLSRMRTLSTFWEETPDGLARDLIRMRDGVAPDKKDEKQVV